MSSAARPTNSNKDEIELSLQGKYGLTLKPQPVLPKKAKNEQQSKAKGAVQRSTRDEVERGLLVKYGLSFAKKSAVPAKEEVQTLLYVKYGLTLNRKENQAGQSVQGQ